MHLELGRSSAVAVAVVHPMVHFYRELQQKTKNLMSYNYLAN